MNALRTIVVVVTLSAPMLGAGPAWADAGDDQFAVAAEHYRNERWQLAAEEFKTLVAKFPDHARRDEAEFFLAESQVQLGDYAGAAEHFIAYRTRAPEGRFAKAALFRGGEAAYLGGKSDDATKLLSAFIEKYADDEMAAYALPYLGRLALDSKQFDIAEKHFQRALDKYPEGPLTEEATFGLARTHEQQGKHADAEAGFAALAAKRTGPIADVAQFRLGLVQYTRGDFAAAEKAFAELKSEFPNTKLAAKADYWRALSIKGQERWEEAAQILVAAAELDPKSALAANLRYHAGDALLAAGQAREAIVQFDHLLAEHADSPLADDALLAKTQALATIDPAAAAKLEDAWKQHAGSPLAGEARRVQAQALIQRQQYDAAVEVLRTLESDLAAVPSTDQHANEIKPQRHTAGYLLAIALHGAGNYDAALAKFSELESVADEPLKSTVQLGRASTLVRLKRFEDAKPLLEQFLASHNNGPDTATCLAELAFCHAGLGQFKDARQRYEEFTKLPESRSSLLSTTHRLAEMAYRGEQRDWAAELFGLLASTGNPPEYVARGLSGQAWCQFSSDDLAGSAATFLRLLEEFPNDPLAAEGALVRGKALEKLGEFDPALLMYRTLVDKFPDAPETPAAILAAAELHERLKQHRDAESYYRQLLEKFPNDAKLDVALYQLAWLLRQNEGAEQAEAERRKAEAETLFERLRHLHKQSPYWSDAVFRLAEAARDRKDAKHVAELVGELATAADTKSTTGEPLVDAQTLAHAFYLQGRFAADSGDWAGTEQAMSALMKRCPQSDLLLAAEFWIAEAAYRQANYDEASRRFEALVATAQGKQAAWLGMIPLRRAQVLAQQKKWPEAIAMAETITKDFPTFAQQYEADYLIGRSLAADGKFDEARGYYAKVIQSPQGGKTETAAMAQWMIGETYFHQQDYAAAVKEYLRVEILYAYPKWQAAALVQAGKAFESDGQWQEAVKLYAQVLKKYGQTEAAGEASTRLRVVEQRAGVAEPKR